MSTTLETEKTALIDQRIPRIDASEKATGAAAYAGDLIFPNMLYASVLRSPHPHARIVSVDTTRAKGVPGVMAVVTGRDAPWLMGENVSDQSILAVDRVRYVGEPVAAVAAVDERTAEAAAKMITVTYELLPPVFDPIASLDASAPLIHEKLGQYKKRSIMKVVAGTNLVHTATHDKGDIAKGFGESDFVFEDTFTVAPFAHAAMEPHCTVALADQDGRITLWTSHDAPYRVQGELASALGLDPGSIRVIVPYVGGNFGGKGGVTTEGIALLLAREVVGRPVRLEFSREEVFIATSTSHASVVTVKTGVKKDGTLVAREVKYVLSAGAYAKKGPTVLMQGCRGAAGPYRIPNVRIEGFLAYTNLIPGDAYRGYGFFQGNFAVESQMDTIAEKLHISPLEIRLRNILENGDTSTIGQEVTSCGLRECLTKVAKEIAFGEKAGNGIGKGIAVGFKNTRTPTSSTVSLTLNWDGTIIVYTALVEVGQGSKHVLAKLTASQLAIPIGKVKVVTSDTETTPWDASTTSSRTVFHQGNALLRALGKATSQLAERLAKAAAVPADSVTFKDGEFVTATRRVGFAYAVRQVMKTSEQIIVSARYEPELQDGSVDHPGVFWLYNAVGVEAHVDQETGQVRVLKVASAHDVGKALDRQGTEGQIVGGTVHGLSHALFEEFKFENGRIMNPNFRDYSIPSAFEAPDLMVPIIVEEPHPDGPLGAKGVGEGPLVSTQSAVANALYQATGIRFKHFPITAENIAMAIAAKEKSAASLA